MDLKSYNLIQSWGTLILKIEKLGYCTLYRWNCTSNHCSQNSFGGKKVNKHSISKKTTRRTSKLDDFYGSVVLKFKPKMRHFCAIFHSGILNVQQHSHVCFFWYLEDIIFRPVSTFFLFDSPIIRGLVKLSTNDMRTSKSWTRKTILRKPSRILSSLSVAQKMSKNAS